MLAVSNLSKTYRRKGDCVRALSDVSLEVARGEFVVVRGPSGCGKTTLLLAAGGLLAPDAGGIKVAGHDPYRLNPNQRATFRSELIGFVFQQFHLVAYLSVIENILTASLGSCKPPDKQRAVELAERFGLAGRASHLPGELSTGERQRTALARAMYNQPQLILADEPTGNLDEDNASTVLNALAEFAQAGRSVLLVTHDESIEKHAARTIHLENGRLA